MGARDSRGHKTPQKIILDAIRLCADCDTCRTLMDEGCVFFPELYRLWERKKEDGVPITEAKLQSLVERCTLCGLCPCPRIPADVMEAKSRHIDREGLSPAVRLLTDVPRMARLCGTFPRLVNTLQSSKALGPLLRKVARLHSERQLPSFPEQ